MPLRRRCLTSTRSPVKGRLGAVMSTDDHAVRRRRVTFIAVGLALSASGAAGWRSAATASCNSPRPCRVFAVEDSRLDSAFAARMIAHHEVAIDMALAELRDGRNEQLRRLAQEIIVTQREEIAVMHLALDQSTGRTARLRTER